MDNKKIVCLGGGIGTVNLIKGLRDYFSDIVVVISMADDGGSAGRLRRLFNILPPGDLVSCMAVTLEKTNPALSKILTYRFKGNRYGKDAELGGQKLGNLIMTAMFEYTHDFEKAIDLFQETFNIKGKFLPATGKAISISAKTKDGKEIFGEETIDLGKYDWSKGLERIIIHPEGVPANQAVINEIKKSDVIIAGPGDLYSTILPVLMVRDIGNALLESRAKKMLVINVTNKPFETNGYAVSDYIKAVKNHLGDFPFDKVIINNNFDPQIPDKYSYSYVKVDLRNLKEYKTKIVEGNIINESFPLYHDSSKLAKVVVENI